MTNSDAEFLAEVENRYPPLAGTYMSLVPRVVIPRLVAMVRERDAGIRSILSAIDFERSKHGGYIPPQAMDELERQLREVIGE